MRSAVILNPNEAIVSYNDKINQSLDPKIIHSSATLQELSSQLYFALSCYLQLNKKDEAFELINRVLSFFIVKYKTSLAHARALKGVSEFYFELNETRLAQENLQIAIDITYQCAMNTNDLLSRTICVGYLPVLYSAMEKYEPSEYSKKFFNFVARAFNSSIKVPEEEWREYLYGNILEDHSELILHYNWFLNLLAKRGIAEAYMTESALEMHLPFIQGYALLLDSYIDIKQTNSAALPFAFFSNLRGIGHLNVDPGISFVGAPLKKD